MRSGRTSMALGFEMAPQKTTACAPLSLRKRMLLATCPRCSMEKASTSAS